MFFLSFITEIVSDIYPLSLHSNLSILALGLESVSLLLVLRTSDLITLTDYSKL